VVAGVQWTPHTHPAHTIPNQHTPTCRYIDDLVLERPANPRTGGVLEKPVAFHLLLNERTGGALLHNRCEAEAPFHNFIRHKSPPTRPQHRRTRARPTKGHHPFQCPRAGTYSRLDPCKPTRAVPQLSPFSFPSCSRNGTLFAPISTVFARGVTKRVH
jgi:hypothetical protein